MVVSFCCLLFVVGCLLSKGGGGEAPLFYVSKVGRS